MVLAFCDHAAFIVVTCCADDQGFVVHCVCVQEFQMKMENLQQRREELERKELELKESLLKFDKFLKENDMKRARALKKTKDEKDAVKTKDREIDRWVCSRVGEGCGEREGMGV